MDTYVSGLIILLIAVLFYLYYKESNEGSVKEGFYPRWGWRRGYWGNFYSPPYYRPRWWARYPPYYANPYVAPYTFW